VVVAIAILSPAAADGRDDNTSLSKTILKNRLLIEAAPFMLEACIFFWLILQDFIRSVTMLLSGTLPSLSTTDPRWFDQATASREYAG
jgi:hypothetical protein